MFTLSEIQAAFVITPLVGFRQNPDSSGTQLTGLTSPSSGIFVSDLHPLLTVQNLASIAPDFVSLGYSGATRDTQFTSWLTAKMNGYAAAFVNDWAGRKFQQRSARSLVERRRLYDSTGSNNLKIANDGKMAGIEIATFRSRGARGRIKEISLHLDTAQNLTVKLYRSGNRAHIETASLEYTTPGDVQWFAVDWELMGEGAYYLCYSQAELTGQAYNDANDRTAFRMDYQLPGERSRYFKAMPFTASIVESGGVGSDEIENTLVVGGSQVFLTSQIGYTPAQTHGLNVGLTVGTDYTDFIVEQKGLFAHAFGLYVAKSLLREMAYNPGVRLNRNENNMSRDALLYEIDGSPQGISGQYRVGLAADYERALSAIQFDTTEIDAMAMPASKAKGVKYRTI